MIRTDGRFLVFSLEAVVYAVDAARVMEILWLPALAPAPGAAAGVVGRCNLRGTAVPVLDMSIRLGRPPHRHAASDRLVVVEHAGQLLGLLAGDVHQLASAGADDWLRETGAAHPSMSGSLQFAEGLTCVLDVPALFQEAPADHTASPPLSDDPAALPLFEARAEALRRPVETQAPGDASLVAVRLSGQHFALDLEHVAEFCNVADLRHLPGCPPHVAGVFKLRGQLFTLLDIASALGLPESGAARRKAVVPRLAPAWKEARVALAMDDILDVWVPGEDELRPPPADFPDARAIVDFRDIRMPLLDLSALLDLDRWIVDEALL